MCSTPRGREKPLAKSIEENKETQARDVAKSSIKLSLEFFYLQYGWLVGGQDVRPSQLGSCV